MTFRALAALAGALLFFAAPCRAQATDPANADVASQHELVIGNSR